MTSPSPEPPAFPVFRAREALPVFLLGWGLGAALLFGVRGLSDLLLADPCRGRTLVALFVPLLLGPGGFGLASMHRGQARRAALGLGLVVSSLFPALYVGALDIGKLRTSGCAGGYLILSEPGQKSTARIELPSGQSRRLQGRLGGYTAQSHPGTFDLRAESSSPQVRVSAPATIRAGQPFDITVSTAPGTPVNIYTLAFLATQGQGIGAPATLEVDVRPAER